MRMGSILYYDCLAFRSGVNGIRWAWIDYRRSESMSPFSLTFLFWWKLDRKDFELMLPFIFPGFSWVMDWDRMVPCAPDGEYFPLPVYGLEEDSDIVFYTANQWRLPANSHVLKESNNVVFRSMFSNNFSFPTEKGTSFLRIDVEDVQGKALDNLLRYRTRITHFLNLPVLPSI